MKKIAFSVVATLWCIAPAFGAPSNTSATFPANGFMLEDYTYTNAATSTNMAGVYENSVDANANYNDCPLGYWCDASGQHACSDLGGGYDNAAAGSTENTQCYRACTVATADIAHAATVTGNDYYGAGTDTCSATSCENGYHVESFDLKSEVGDVDNIRLGFINPDGTGQNASNFGLTENGTFAVEYKDNKGTIKGRAQCSSQSGTGLWNGATTASEITTLTTLPNSTGMYCWCIADEYIPVDGSSMSLTGRWVFYDDGGYSSRCTTLCGGYCAAVGATYGGNLVFRAAVLGAVTGGAAMCAPNTISITWGGASQNDIDANNAGTCVYGGEIRTPVAAEVIPGKTFIGWKIVRAQLPA